MDIHISRYFLSRFQIYLQNNFLVYHYNDNLCITILMNFTILEDKIKFLPNILKS